MEPEIDPRFDDDRVTALGLLVEAHAAIMRALEPTLDEAGLSHQWFEVLLRLGRTPGHRLRMAELAASMSSITPSGLTRLVDRLAEAGLVERVQCQEDRRGAFAVLTPAGADRLAAVMPAHLADIDANFTSVLSAEERRVVARAMRKLRDHLADHPRSCS